MRTRAVADTASFRLGVRLSSDPESARSLLKKPCVCVCLCVCV
jgi:hypothetical protein